MVGHNVLLGVMVGKIFKTTITQTLAGEEPMVDLDSAALTERIGTIAHPVQPPEAVYQPITRRPEPTEPRWRSYLRARPAS